MADPYYVSALKSGDVWANDRTGVTLNYMFWTSTPSYYASTDPERSNFRAFTAEMKEAVRDIFDQLSSFANISFHEVSVVGQAQLGFGQARLDPDAGAWAYYPGSDPYSGDVWTNNRYSDTTDMTLGEYGFSTLMHEIGHALGLKHSFERPAMPAAEDTSQYTVMSYTSPYEPISYMLYDIAALQSMYGANMSYHTGNDNYELQWGYAYTIWDAGGTDVLDGSAFSGAMTLNLNAGKYSSVGLTNNITIAYNVTIEGAEGGSGADTIYANNAGNTINGNGGNDRIYNGTGADHMDGGDGTDTFYFNGRLADFAFAFVDAVTVTARSLANALDTLLNFESFVFTNGTYNRAQLEAAATPDPGGGTGGGGGGDLVLNGTNGNDTLNGGAGNDTLNGGKGLDNMAGGAGDDLYVVDSVRDVVTELAGEGTDTVQANVSWTLGAEVENLTFTGRTSTTGTGNAKDNVMTGNLVRNILNGMDGNDVLNGAEGRDVLLGGLDDDILNGGLAKDTLTGGGGADTFIFDAPLNSTHADVITDFNATEGDRLDISDMLTGYNAGTSDAGDFVQLVQSGRNMQLKVDADGALNGHKFTLVATLNNTSGLATDDLIANGFLLLS